MTQKICLLFTIPLFVLSCRGTTPTAATTPTKSEVPQVSQTAPVATESSHKEKHEEAHSTDHKNHAVDLKTGTDPETALRWLKNGNRRFAKAFFRNDGASMKDVKRLSAEQKPHSIVLSCSDSRVPPEVVFDQKLGEIFTVRTAGEVIEPATIGTIEYAVEHLGARNLVVLGHTNCGAVKAALSTLGGKDAGSANLNHLVKDIHPRLASFEGRTPSEHFHDEGWANVNGVVKDLMLRSKILEEKIKAGHVKINSGLYNLETGLVEFRH